MSISLFRRMLIALLRGSIFFRCLHRAVKHGIYILRTMSKPQKQIPESVKTLAANVGRLSRLLTQEREELPSAYLKDAGLREAYVSYFLAPNAAKIRLPLQELGLHPDRLLSQETLRILDIGSGPGTALLGLMEFFACQDKLPRLEFLATDQVAENLKEAEKLFAEHCAKTGVHASLKTVQCGIEEIGQRAHGLFDIIILSNVLNELYSKHADKITKRTESLNSILLQLLAEQGSCIIIEPALRETSRELLLVRDKLLGLGFHVYSPCLCSMACPALANPKDWCHEDLPWEAPELIKDIDSLIGLRKDSLKFSYVVLRKETRSLLDACMGNVFRVVSEPLISKGKIEFYLCGAGGRRLITRQDKDRTDANHVFEDLRRGAVVSFEHLIDEGKRYKVGKDTVVRTAVMENCRA